MHYTVWVFSPGFWLQRAVSLSIPFILLFLSTMAEVWVGVDLSLEVRGDGAVELCERVGSSLPLIEGGAL